MRTISGMFKSINMVIGFQRYDSGNCYSPIPYLMELIVDNKLLIFNVMTREILLLFDAEIESWKNGSLDIGTRKRLVEHWFLIPSNIDARSIVYTFKHGYGARFTQPGKLELFTIFTTTECNARCPYCYEAGCQKRTMHKNVALDVAKFVVSHGNPDNLHLKWFGGEPLCNSDAIDIVCNYLQEQGVRYSSSLVTNGYLLNRYDEARLKTLWNLNRVQITLDGTKEIYNKTKNYTGDYDAFERVLKNIAILLEMRIRVNVRLNLSLENHSDLSNLVNVLKQRFHHNKNLINVYSHPLFEDAKNMLSDTERAGLYSQYMDLQEKILKSGLSGKQGIPKVRTYNCMADDGKSAVILPGGELSLCEHHCDDEYYGTIYSDEYDSDVIQRWSEPADEIPECQTCFYYPACLNLKKCPGKAVCNIEQRRFVKYKIHVAMMRAYENFLEEGSI